MSPQFHSLSEFLNMNGYAPYVWSAWIITLIAIIILALKSVFIEKKWQKRIEFLNQQIALIKNKE